jgi:ABC-type transport system involved in multi-copper enzyme maturation permease subunit
VKAIPAIPASPPVIERMRSPILSAAVMKEIRALLPVWLVALAMPLLILWQCREHPAAIEWAWAVSVLGWVIMAALSVGHEFGYRTVTLLLVQPVPREQLWRKKRIVLACAFITTFALSVWAGWSARAIPLIQDAGGYQRFLGFLGALALCSFFMTPWLAMLSRHTLGGSVFSLALPGLLALGTRLLASLWFRISGTEPKNEEAHADPIWWAALALCGLAGWALGRRKFLKLEAVDSPGVNVALPQWLLSAAQKIVPRPVAGAGGWLGHLVRKELHLQQLTFYVAGLFFVAWLVQMAAKWINPQTHLESLPAQAIACAALVALLAGSVSCAEERSDGTLEWHLTLPVPAWKQWLVKSGVALSLTVLVGVVFPSVLALVTQQLRMVRSEMEMDLHRFLITAWGGLWLLWLATVAIYASSVSGSTAHAVILALAVTTCLTVGAGVIGNLLAEKTWPLTAPFISALARWIGYAHGVSPHAPLVRVIFALAFVMPPLLNLALAYSNFRRIRPGLWAFSVQVLGLALLYGVAGYLYACLEFAR